MPQARTASLPTLPVTGATAGSVPAVRVISLADIKDALAKGMDDFRAMPKYIVFLGIIYGVLCLLAVRFAFDYSVLPLAFPLVGGFALLGPFAAIGLYELSRRREHGMDTSWWHMAGVFRSAAAPSILGLGLLLMVAFFAWLLAARVVYQSTFGNQPLEPTDFLGQLFTTGHGWTLILLGNALGAAFALVVFSATVVSFPMLVDRRVSVMNAVKTSINAVLTNPFPMLVWALIVVGSLIVGSIPLFVGLAVVLPVLGHSTWHLYKNLVET